MADSLRGLKLGASELYSGGVKRAEMTNFVSIFTQSLGEVTRSDLLGTEVIHSGLKPVTDIVLAHKINSGLPRG